MKSAPHTRAPAPGLAARHGCAVWLSGAAPSIVGLGALFAAAFVILVPVAIWIYALIFAFSSLWFSHYGLAALQALRAEEDIRAAQATAIEPDIVLDAPPSSPPFAP